jgi:tetratricopeptide (TPR) repeat protein
MTALRIGLFWIVLGALMAPARAEDRAAAREAYIAGVKYYDLAQYDEALASFKKAYWNYEDPVILFNIAQCHRALNQKPQAVEFYRSYLRKAPADVRNRRDVERIINELNAAIEKEKAVTIAAPQGTIGAETRPSPGPIATAAPPEHPQKPWYKRGWVWGVVGGVAAVAVVVGVGVGVGTQPHDPSSSLAVKF